MKLTDKDGYSITFEVSGYGYLSPYAGSDWLTITTFVTHPRGTWKTTHESLLTDELESLRYFFKKILDNPAESRDLFFTEPNLGFQYFSEKSKQILKILFYLEPGTYWFEKNDDLDMTNLSLEIPFDPNEFKSALESMTEYCDKVP